MRAIRVAAALASILCAGCDHPTEPARPWISGRWNLVDTIAVNYAFADYYGSDTTVSFDMTESRDASLDLSRVAIDSMAAAIRGTFHFLRRSSPFGARTEFHDESSPLEFTDTIRVTTRYIYGMYMSGPDDSIPVPPAAVTEIHWVADTLAVCASLRRALDVPGSKFVPEAFACRHRIHWRRP